MRGSVAAREREEGGDLYDRIAAFLADHGLSADPAHYSFAHAILTHPDGPIATAVARLTRGGVRLSRHDVEALGGTVVEGEPLRARPVVDRATADPAVEERAALVAETHATVDGLATMMREIHDQTRGVERDLQHSAEVIAGKRDIAWIDEIAQLTGSMLTRVRDAEARLAAATMEADALRAKLAEASDHARRDPLTGLANRRAFEEAFASLDPAHGPYCLAVCDIDRFKRINDDHGHAVGDRVLSAVGRTLAAECGRHLVTRHGGEEFAILLAGLDLVTAADHLDDVRALVAAKRFRNRETDQPLGQITLSIGVTALHEADESSDALRRADRLLYTAKAEGRDRVCAA